MKTLINNCILEGFSGKSLEGSFLSTRSESRLFLFYFFFIFMFFWNYLGFFFVSFVGVSFIFFSSFLFSLRKCFRIRVRSAQRFLLRDFHNKMNKGTERKSIRIHVDVRRVSHTNKKRLYEGERC